MIFVKELFSVRCLVIKTFPHPVSISDFIEALSATIGLYPIDKFDPADNITTENEGK
jgi:hypothetical protein